MKHKLTFFGLTLVIVLAGTPVQAQSNSIRIENGVVYVNGNRQAPERLPASLEFEGLTASLSFSGDTHFRLGENAYRIVEGRLVETEPSEDDFVIFLGRGDGLLWARDATGARGFFPAPEHGAFKAHVADGSVFTLKPFGQYYEVLDAQLQELHRVADQENAAIGLRLKQEAQETARIVRAFPQVELQSYLLELQNRNEPLYDGILKEHLMDMETQRLASRILATQNRRQQAELRDELHDRLEEIFELKQANRRAEIDQLDARLRELRSQVDARQRNREEIIERRIQELLRQNN